MTRQRRNVLPQQRRNVLPRRRRGLTASLAALAVLALCVLGAVAAIQIRYGLERTALGHTSLVAAWLRTRTWADSSVLVAGIALGLVGLWFVLAGLLPARRSFVRLEDVDPETIMGITRVGLARDLNAVALAVDGVDAAKVRTRRRRVRVRAASPLRDITGIRDALEAALTNRLALLQPTRPLSVRVRVTAPTSKRSE